jgi:DegV family protein with EDD domain
MLKVKPIIIMDKEGHLINVGKVRGRKAVLKELFERLKSNINIDELNYVYISQADCMEDAKYLEAMVKEEYAQAEIVIGDIGPVIGAHTGPGGLALCYLGKTVKGE